MLLIRSFLHLRYTCLSVSSCKAESFLSIGLHSVIQLTETTGDESTVFSGFFFSFSHGAW